MVSSDQIKGTIVGIVIASILDAAGVQDAIEARVEAAINETKEMTERESVDVRSDL